jgi:hypothetical protein
MAESSALEAPQPLWLREPPPLDDRRKKRLRLTGCARAALTLARFDHLVTGRARMGCQGVVGFQRNSNRSL